MKRRDFLKNTGLSIGAVTALPAGLAQSSHGKAVALVIEPSDTIANAAHAGWAADELAGALMERGIAVTRHDSIQRAPANSLVVLAAGYSTPSAAAILKSATATIPTAPECLALVPGNAGGRPLLLASGSDSRGLMYALLELAGRVKRAADPSSALNIPSAITERPQNPIRSIARLFVSDVEDKPWFNDREMWPAYFSMLAAQRFNRFNLSFGIGYDFLREVTDAYFLFLYPFLLSVPGYNVRAVNLPDAERDSNLNMLRFISEQAAAHGLHFQLGIWTHGYQWANSPHANYTIEGVTADNHAAYSREALSAVLKACPAISGVTFRIHGESGVPEGNYPFWKTVFEGVTGCGRKVEIDMHAKGIDQSMIDVGLATGMPLNVSPKYWAEHMGMPYHQADIREQEMPRPERNVQGFFALSSGSRNFTRYGYADLLREDRRYGVLHRVWPGTQRLLVWGDPVTAAAYSHAFGFCGSKGVELCEPLSFKGRRGSGLAGGRCAYADASLKPRWDWQKYLHSYRVWGRHLYNPKADPDSWRGDMSPALAAALSSVSRILPIVTTAHLPSAANNTFWPEIYTNQPIVDARKNNPYGDTPAPKVFGNVSPLDPQLFSRMNDCADELLKGERTGKYSPIEVAQWLEDLAGAAEQRLAESEAHAPAAKTSDFRRVAVDVRIQIGLGRFYAAKFRSGVLYGIHERSGDRTALEEAVKAYRKARAIWAQIADETKGIYVADVTVGELRWLRGHWLDRLPAIDGDLFDMANKLESAAAAGDQSPKIKSAIQEALGHPKRVVSGRHTPPARFQPGQPIPLNLSLPDSGKPASVRLHYRHVNQAERYQLADMQPAAQGYGATIPASYTESPYPLQYYFEVRAAANNAWLYPGFAPDLANQPYFVIRSVG